MKKKLIIVLCALTAILAFSCSSEIVNNLKPESIKENSSTYSDYQVVDGSNIKVTFSPVAYAKNYSYSTNGGGRSNRS